MLSKSWWDLQYPSVMKKLISFSHEGILLSRNGFDAIYVAHVCDTIEGAKIPLLVGGQQHQTAVLSYFKIPRSHSLVFMLQLFALLRRIAEPIPFLPPFFTPPEISLFWEMSIAINTFGTQKVVPTPVGRKCSIGPSLLTSFLSITLTYLLFPSLLWQSPLP